VPTPLVIALHGGGPGGRSTRPSSRAAGEDALPVSTSISRNAWGCIVVCPTAVVAPWDDRKTHRNDQLVQSLLAEIKMLYKRRSHAAVYLTGHSMGGFGSWFFGGKIPRMVDRVRALRRRRGARAEFLNDDLPVYVYHGSDDPIVPVASDRKRGRSSCAATARRRRRRTSCTPSLDDRQAQLPGVGGERTSSTGSRAARAITEGPEERSSSGRSRRSMRSRASSRSTRSAIPKKPFATAGEETLKVSASPT